VINGDTVVGHQDISRLTGKQDTTLALFETSDTWNLGTVLVAEDRISHIYEKAKHTPSHLANAGIYLFTPDIFLAIDKTPKSPRGEYEITESLQLIIDQGHPVGYEIIDRWLDLSYPWDLLPANESLLKGLDPQKLGTVEENVTLKDRVSIGPDTIVRSGSYIIGPVVIGSGCDIGPNCYIRPATAIGNNCHIGAACEVKNSIIMNGSKVPHHNYVGDSVIGENCNLGSGTKIANLKLDKKNVIVSGRDTGRRKLGAILGDHVETGINAGINVGSTIGNNTHIGPGAMASGDIAPASRIF
jgi:bifunctional UDP-N-acetylglucosamine pyrophosphorylase/glucosamine-1-phosphate N-acetyltransferase